MPKYIKNITFIIAFALFSLFLFFGIFTFKDYGISIDEEFHRLSGFYWLEYVLKTFGFEEFKEVVNLKTGYSGFTVPHPENHPYYGIVFDLPLALTEVIFEIKDPRDYFYLRHILNFLIFFISSIYFFKLILNRFKNYDLALIGTLFYVLSPRIYGHSFFNNKDIIFLSICSIALYYCFVAIDKSNYKNLIIFAFFSALSTASRILGIFFPISFIMLILLDSNQKKIEVIKPLVIFVILYCLFTFLLWPAIWEDTLNNLVLAFKYFSDAPLGIKTFFNGEYLSVKFLPMHYTLTWIIITTPVLYLILFLFGYTTKFKRTLLKFFKIEKNSNRNDLWSSISEKKDFFVFFNLTGFLFYLTFSGVLLYTGWRQTFFLNIFIIYFAVYGSYLILIKIKKDKKKFFYLLISTYLFFIIYQISYYHPYQNTYFNTIGNKIFSNKFEADYWGLSGKKALDEIIKKEGKNKKNIKISVAAWYPLERSSALLNKNDREKLLFVGQNYQESDYLFTNFISEVDKNYNNKYDIPSNFKKIESFKLHSYNIYEIYKKGESK